MNKTKEILIFFKKYDFYHIEYNIGGRVRIFQLNAPTLQRWVKCVTRATVLQNTEKGLSVYFIRMISIPIHQIYKMLKKASGTCLAFCSQITFYKYIYYLYGALFLNSE